MKEPNPVLMQVCAIPFAVLNLLVLGVPWFLATPLSIKTLVFYAARPSALLLLFALVVVHEMLHALAHPQQGKSENSVLGVWPSKLLFYAHYDGEISRNRFLAILLMPLILLSILPLGLCAALQQGPPIIAWLAIWNALFACGDLLGATLVVSQVPGKATVRNQGWRTYWKHQ